MATSQQQLAFAIRAVNEASKALKEVGDDIDGLSGKAEGGDKKVGGFGSTLKNVGTIAGGIIAAQGLSKVGGLFTSAVGAASDLNEALSKSNNIFGENAKAIEDWAEDGARNFGLAKGEALTAASTFGNMFTQMGVGTDEAAAMSKQITELAADFASFHNADITSVIDAQSAAFRGEYDSLQRFLPLINAAAVEAKAAEMGLVDYAVSASEVAEANLDLELAQRKATAAVAKYGADSIEARQALQAQKEAESELALAMRGTSLGLTEQDKALAVHALMLEGAGEAAGDFERTSDGLANQQRILSAEWQNAKAALGTALMPALSELLRLVLDEVIPALDRFGAYWTENIQPDIDTFLKFVAEEVMPELQEQFAKFQEYYQTDIKPALENIETAVRETVEFIIEHWAQIEPFVRPIFISLELAAKSFRDALKIIIDLIGGDWDGAWEGIKDLVGNALDAIEAMITTWKDQVVVLVGLVSGAFGGIAGAAESAFRGVLGTVTGIINGLIDAYNGSVGKIPGVANIPRIGGGGGSTSTYGVDPGIANAYGTLNPNGTITPPANGGGSLFVPSGATLNAPISTGLGGGGGGGGTVNVTVQGSVWSLDELAAELNRRGLVAA